MFRGKPSYASRLYPFLPVDADSGVLSRRTPTTEAALVQVRETLRRCLHDRRRAEKAFKHADEPFVSCCFRDLARHTGLRECPNAPSTWLSVRPVALAFPAWWFTVFCFIFIFIYFFNSVAMWTVLSGVLKRRLAIQTIDDGKTVRYMYCCAHCQAVTLSSGSLQAVWSLVWSFKVILYSKEYWTLFALLRKTTKN